MGIACDWFFTHEGAPIKAIPLVCYPDSYMAVIAFEMHLYDLIPIIGMVQALCDFSVPGPFIEKSRFFPNFRVPPRLSGALISLKPRRRGLGRPGKAWLSGSRIP